MSEEKLLLLLKKTAEKSGNKIVLPKTYVDKWGREISMKIYADGKIVIEPSKKGE